MAEREEAVREFVAVTDVDEERARFFLESAGWDLQVRDTLNISCLKYSAVIYKHQLRFQQLLSLLRETECKTG